MVEDSFVYRVRRERIAAPLRMDETVYAPGQLLPCHVHPCAVLFSVLQGRASHTIGGETRTMAPGEVAFVPPNTPHSILFGERIARAFSIELDASVANASSGRLPSRPLHTSDAPLLGALLGTYRLFASRQAVPATTVADSLVAALEKVDRRPCDAPSADVRGWLRTALERVRANAGGSVRMSLIAHDVGVHPVHLSRRFHEVFGESMSEFRERVRLEQVSRALLTQTRTISSIAAELGFSDHAHLTRSFRRAMHMTPSEFREMIGETSLPHDVISNHQGSHTFVVRPSTAAGIRVA